MNHIDSDIVAEGRRLATRAEEEGMPLRLLGGVAIRLRADDSLPQPFVRRYNDLDWITAKGFSARTQDFFKANHYEPHVRFNALHGQERLLFFDRDNDREVDVFVGSFRMSHEIPMDGRLEVDSLTIPLADLLLTKLQVVELNDKDVRDALAILQGHEVSDRDGDAINGSRIASLCAGDWGLWRTFTANLATCGERLDSYDLSGADRANIAARLKAIEDRIDEEAKSRRWRLRARIGERKRWYELPEEKAGGRA